MSVLTSPRIYFKGTMSWDPGVANTTSSVYDSRAVEVKIPAGTTNATFPEFLINNLARFGVWNLYGSHDAKFEHYAAGRNQDSNTRVVGGTVGPGQGDVDADSLLGMPVNLNGKLVDLDPEAVWNSQIFFDQFSLGDNTVGVTAPRFATMHSRWINFRRNLDRLDIAGAAGVVWQTVFPKETLTFSGIERSALLQEFKRQIDNDPSVLGLMLRFSTYRTLYFQNGIFNNTLQQPRDIPELIRLHQRGEFFSNSAYSRLTGVVGLWHQGDPSTWPGGRFLIPTGSIPSFVVGGTPISLGPAVAEIANSRLILDLLHTIPEANRQLDKVDLGELIVCLRGAGELTELGRIPADTYGRVNYERRAGIVEIPLVLTDWLNQRLANSDLVVFGVGANGRVPLLEERRFNVVAERRDIYLDQGVAAVLPIKVFDRGALPAAATRVIVGKYERLSRTTDPVIELPVGADGTASVPLNHGATGPIDYGLSASLSSESAAVLTNDLDITAGQFFSTRTLPMDANLALTTTDEQLTWDFVYNNILRNWDLVNPIMNLRGLPLNDQATIESLASRIAEVIDNAPDMFDSTHHMPVTRDLSSGKRELLKRWAALHS